jgi:hypothetical protein
MHLAKGLEFKAVAVMACGDESSLSNPGSSLWLTRSNWTTFTRLSASFSMSPARVREIAC